MENKTSHDYADSLVRLAEFIKSKPAFTIAADDVPARFRCYFWFKKDHFLSAVRVLGSGVKREKNGYGEDELEFVSASDTGESVELVIKRNLVCRLVRPAQPAEYDCEPLLSQFEAELVATQS